MLEAFEADADILDAVRADLLAVLDRDSATHEMYIPFLYYKGFHALQAHRVAHWLWKQGSAVPGPVYPEPREHQVRRRHSSGGAHGPRHHAGSRHGPGDRRDGRVGNNVSILQSVTLGGTGKEDGDRHPKICDGVLISAGAKILGNIRVGQGAKVGAGSVVLEDVPPHTTVAGVPAKVVGKPSSDSPALDMDHCWPCYDE
jgi:serine O-acetyltransferase